MVQRKYLIFIIAIFYTDIVLSSPWIPTSGSYKYLFTTLINNKSTNLIADAKISIFTKIEEHIQALEQTRDSMNAYVKLYNPSRLEIIKNTITRLKAELNNLSSFIDTWVINNEIEYGINSHSSLGMKILNKRQKFVKAAYRDTKPSSTHYNASMFYKYKIWQERERLFTLSPQITICKTKGAKEKIYVSLSLMEGNTKKIKYGQFFSASEIMITKALNKFSHSKNIYSASLTMGVKFTNGITICNYSKYNLCKHCSPVYRKTLYEQLNISKSLPGTRFKELAIGIGYFWHYSFTKPSYRVLYNNSGLIFSIIVET